MAKSKKVTKAKKSKKVESQVEEIVQASADEKPVKSSKCSLPNRW